MNALGLVVLEIMIFHVIHTISLWQIMMPPGRAQFGTPRGMLAGFTKGITEHCYTQNIKSMCLMVSEENIFYVFPIISLWELMTPGV